jgi:hypothetical protein
MAVRRKRAQLTGTVGYVSPGQCPGWIRVGRKVVAHGVGSNPAILGRIDHIDRRGFVHVKAQVDGSLWHRSWKEIEPAEWSSP